MNAWRKMLRVHGYKTSLAMLCVHLLFLFLLCVGASGGAQEEVHLWYRESPTIVHNVNVGTTMSPKNFAHCTSSLDPSLCKLWSLDGTLKKPSRQTPPSARCAPLFSLGPGMLP